MARLRDGSPFANGRRRAYAADVPEGASDFNKIGKVQLLVLSEDELKIRHILKPLFG